MRLTIDADAGQLMEEGPAGRRRLPLYSPEAFTLLSRLWVRVGWTQKYSYAFSWLGRPVVQLPEDLVRIQKIIYRVRPGVIIETGVAHGGSLIFYASLCQAMGSGRVIGVDIQIRPHNRAAIEAHPLGGRITLIEADSTAPATVEQVRSLIQPGEAVLVILDSCHTKAHVLAELHDYAPFVSAGSYIVATDGIMEDLTGVPGGRPEWSWDNPRQAALEFVGRRTDFALEDPTSPFCESAFAGRATYWPSAYLRRVA